MRWGMVMTLVCALVPGAEGARVAADSLAAARSVNEFGMDLFGLIRKRGGNLFFSPYSIASALAMTSAGAAGATATQMRAVLHLSGDPSQVQAGFAALTSDLTRAGERGEFRLSIANALWGQTGEHFLPGFLDLVRTGYGAGLTPLDFHADPEAARRSINGWVEQQTQNRIRDLLAQGMLDRSTRLVLTNAIYFKGIWKREFAGNATRQEHFTLTSGGTVTVPMMNGSGEFPYAATPEITMLALPYRGGRLSMVIILPSDAGSLAAVESGLTAAGIAAWIEGMKSREVEVALPSFTVSRTSSLEEILVELGMQDAFREGRADFSGINGKKDLVISAVAHKAFVEVNEEGTEAAAATGVAVKGVRAPAYPPVRFRADHPFLFLIRDNPTGAILFIGRIENPLEQ